MARVEHIGIDPSTLRQSGLGRAKASTTNKFDMSLAGASADAMMGVANAAVGSSGNATARTVLSAAFGGLSQGVSAGMGGMGGSSGVYMSSGADMTGLGGLTGTSGASGTAVVPGTEGFSQADMMNTMNQNNLQLLELQAMMQNNMQAWNTKSNILNADHRVKTTMIEKLSPR